MAEKGKVEELVDLADLPVRMLRDTEAGQRFFGKPVTLGGQDPTEVSFDHEFGGSTLFSEDRLGPRDAPVEAFSTFGTNKEFDKLVGRDYVEVEDLHGVGADLSDLELPGGVNVATRASQLARYDELLGEGSLTGDNPLGTPMNNDPVPKEPETDLSDIVNNAITLNPEEEALDQALKVPGVGDFTEQWMNGENKTVADIVTDVTKSPEETALDQALKVPGVEEFTEQYKKEKQKEAYEKLPDQTKAAIDYYGNAALEKEKEDDALSILGYLKNLYGGLA